MRLAAVACLLTAAAAGAAEDAAVKAREGEIGHWIEYYRRERAIEPPDRPERRRTDVRTEDGAAAPSKGRAPHEVAPRTQ